MAVYIQQVPSTGAWLFCDMKPIGTYANEPIMVPSSYPTMGYFEHAFEFLMRRVKEIGPWNTSGAAPTTPS